LAAAPIHIKGKPKIIRMALPITSPPAQSCIAPSNDGNCRDATAVAALTTNPEIPAMAKTEFMPRPTQQ